MVDVWCQLLHSRKAHEMVINVIPSDLACSYMSPSTSDDTAEVHSSRKA